FFNSHVLQLPSHALTVDRIAVAHEISRRGIPGKSLNQLLRHPFCGWMSGNIEVDHSTPVVSEDQEDIENMERDGRDREEVNRNKFLAVIFQKRAPSLRGWLWTPAHVLGDGRSSIPSLRISPCTRGAPQSGFALLMVCGSARGRPWESKVSRLARAGFSRSKRIGNLCDARRGGFPVSPGQERRARPARRPPA